MARVPGGTRTGASFTGVTFNWKLLLAVPPLASVTMIVMALEPNWLVAGVTTMERLAAFPPKLIPDGATRLVLEEEAVTTRAEAVVSESPMVKPNVLVEESSVIVWSARFEIV